MDRRLPVILAIVILAAAAIAFIATGGPDSGTGPEDPVVPPTDPEPEVPDDALPEGYTFDPSAGVLSYVEPTDWHVFDEYHAYMNTDRSVYTGSDIPGSGSIRLDSGRYTVTSEGNEMTVDVPGEVSREATWTFDMDGVKHRVRISFSIPMDLYGPQTDGSAGFNGGFGGRTPMFYELPKQVIADSVLDEIVSQLGSEYTRIGGSTDDRQGYADFIASMVQLTIAYPPWIDYQTDLYIWGASEYWASPLETLYHMTGDCDDTAVLLCALYEAAGYVSAVGGHAGHVFTGVHLDSFSETPRERLDSLGVGKQMEPSSSFGVSETTRDGREVVLSDILFYSVETIFDQVPVGYLGGGNGHLDQYTFWGWAGFYTKDTKVV